jgi:hypothetical protein
VVADHRSTLEIPSPGMAPTSQEQGRGRVAPARPLPLHFFCPVSGRMGTENDPRSRTSTLARTFSLPLALLSVFSLLLVPVQPDLLAIHRGVVVLLRTVGEHYRLAGGLARHRSRCDDRSRLLCEVGFVTFGFFTTATIKQACRNLMQQALGSRGDRIRTCDLLNPIQTR